MTDLTIDAAQFAARLAARHRRALHDQADMIADLVEEVARLETLVAAQTEQLNTQPQKETV